jgi:protein-S-isoprenylcysteine O-methyltransferase Ste14
MNRGAGSGLIGFGVVLLVVGAILAYAVTAHTTGFNINTAGVIAMVVGIVSVVIGIAMFALGSRSRSTSVDRVVDTPSGQERVSEQEWS